MVLVRIRAVITVKVNTTKTLTHKIVPRKKTPGIRLYSLDVGFLPTTHYDHKRDIGTS